MCIKVSETGLKSLAVSCRALLKLVSLPFGPKPKFSSNVFVWLMCCHCFQDVCGCSLLSRQAIGNASALLPDCAVKSSLSDENSFRQRVERFAFCSRARWCPAVCFSPLEARCVFNFQGFIEVFISSCFSNIPSVTPLTQATVQQRNRQHRQH